MKIAITHPTTFGRQRRGTERFIHDLGVYLSQRGHAVSVITCKPGRTETVDADGYRTISYRRLWHPAFARVGLLEFQAFMPTVFGALLSGDYDVVHCCSFADAYVANIARRFTGVPTVLLVNALPPRVRYFRSLSTGGAVFRRAVQNSDAVIPVSGYVSDYVANRFGRTGDIIPPPLDLDRFGGCARPRLPRPSILCAAALEDARKGGRALMRAFNLVKQARPDVELHIASHASAALRRELTDLVDSQWKADVRFSGEGRAEDLPSVYASATVSVLPSLWEAFGLVITESLAMGTPVVGTNDGAIPELITPEVGRLFDPGDTTASAPTNVEGLAHALIEGVQLGERPETAAKCRAHVTKYGWPAVGPRFEETYARVIAARRAAQPITYAG